MLSTIASTLAGVATPTTPNSTAEEEANSPSSSSGSASTEKGIIPDHGNTLDSRGESTPKPSDSVGAQPVKTIPEASSDRLRRRGIPELASDVRMKASRQGAGKDRRQALMSPRTPLNPGKTESHYPRRAEQHHLPGYPPVGLARPESAGAAAASLAHSTTKPIEIWKPRPISAAGAAASLAHANRDAGGVRTNSPTGSPSGRARLDQPPTIVHDSKNDWPLRGARGAMDSQRNRRRASSSPAGLQYKGGIVCGNGTWRHDSGFVTGPDDHIGTTAQAKQKADIRSAATASMASDRRKREAESTTLLGTRCAYDTGKSSTSLPSQRPWYPHLEKAARRQANERLARIGYVSNSSFATGVRPRSISLASSNLHTKQIESSKRKLSEDIDRTDKQKRGQDALLLMSTARKNVEDRLSEQDRRIAESRGLIYREDWSSKATEIAQRQSAQRMQNHGQIDIGGGAYMSQEEIDKIAERNVKPVIDNLNECAGEYHQMKRERREEKVREMEKKRGKRNQKEVFGFKHPSAEVPADILTAGNTENLPEISRNATEDAVSETQVRYSGRERQMRDDEETSPEQKVHPMPSRAPEGEITLLDKIVGRRHRRTYSESRGAFNSMGMVRDHLLRKNKVYKNDPDISRPATAPASAARLSDENFRPASSGSLHDESITGGGTLDRLKRGISRLSASDAAPSTQDSITPSMDSLSPPPKQTRESRGSIGSILDRFTSRRAGRVEHSERPTPEAPLPSHRAVHSPPPPPPPKDSTAIEEEDDDEDLYTDTREQSGGLSPAPVEGNIQTTATITSADNIPATNTTIIGEVGTPFGKEESDLEMADVIAVTTSTITSTTTDVAMLEEGPVLEADELGRTRPVPPVVLNRGTEGEAVERGQGLLNVTITRGSKFREKL